VELQAETTIYVGVAQVRRWFYELEAHPERYRFATHEGFYVTEGRFGVVGARFQTQERFHGLQLSLEFELTAVEENRFCFRVVRPALPVWGAFEVEAIADDKTLLCLGIGGTTWLGRSLLRCPGVNEGIRRQICAEANHIKASVEAIYPGRPSIERPG
jgi:hypothetical protein